MQKKLAVFFISSASVILLVTGTAKILSAITGGQVLQTYDSVFGTPLRDLFWFVGAVEVCIAMICLFGERIDLQAGLVFWIGANFAIYRIGLLWVGGPQFCSCLGTLTGALRLSPAAADSAMKFALAYLLAGSATTLLWLWKRNRRFPYETPKQ